ncbi:hypothetical protein QFZ66_001534 [Streptomyces sp. B4I13]|nr:hypothetical protein [Streptomyces sp. B4I13]
MELAEREDDLMTNAAPLDWLGLNCSFPQAVADDLTGPASRAPAWTGRSTRAASRT